MFQQPPQVTLPTLGWGDTSVNPPGLSCAEGQTRRDAALMGSGCSKLPQALCSASGRCGAHDKGNLQPPAPHFTAATAPVAVTKVCWGIPTCQTRPTALADPAATVARANLTLKHSFCWVPRQLAASHQRRMAPGLWPSAAIIPQPKGRQ